MTTLGCSGFADRIANNRYWDGPVELGNALVWVARLPHAGGWHEVGRMELTADRLTVMDFRALALSCTTARGSGRYQLTNASLLPAPRDTAPPLASVVTFAANGHITVDGPATPLLVLLLAQRLLA